MKEGVWMVSENLSIKKDIVEKVAGVLKEVGEDLRLASIISPATLSTA
jgi:hypothetical protein